MDNSVTTPLKRHRLHYFELGHSKYLYLLSNLLPVAATALIFFLPYYFVSTLQFSLLQAGLLMSCYGIGIFMAILLTPYLSLQYVPRKIILFALLTNCIALSPLLYAKTSLLLSFSLALLGFAGYLFKNNHPHLLLQQAEDESNTQTKILQQSYIASNIGLGLAMLIIAIFDINNFKALFITAIVLNALPLFFLPRDVNTPRPICFNAHPTPTLFSLLLLFLGGLLLSQFTATYGIYLCLQYPHVGLTAMAIFMLTNVFIVSWLQKPMLAIFNRGSKVLHAGCGVLLIGLGYYIISLAHIFTLVILSAMIISLGELFFISSLHYLCKRFFQGTLAVSLIVGASLSAYLYQFFGANILWQSCAYVGIACFVLALIYCALQRMSSYLIKLMRVVKPRAESL
jgi:hypothetical protein